MKWRVMLPATLLLVALAAPAPGQSFFSKKKTTKPNPAERVTQLVQTLKTDQDEGNRESAAAELRQFDPKTYPEVIPVLIESLQNDPRPSVRMEAAQSLGRIRPVSQQAGWALEQAAAKDSSWRVRAQARTSLWYYRLVGGYRSDTKPPEDQPDAPLPVPPKSGTSAPPIIRTLRPGTTPGETAPPPLAVPPGQPQPLPSGPKLQPVPVKPSGPGPDLLPPDR